MSNESSDYETSSNLNISNELNNIEIRHNNNDINNLLSSDDSDNKKSNKNIKSLKIKNKMKKVKKHIIEKVCIYCIIL